MQKTCAALVLAGLLSGCAGSDSADTALISDPIEPVNRASHVLNKGLDTIALRPAAKGFQALPEPAQDGLGNFASNLGEPVDALNFALQGDASAALTGVARFSLNSTIGLFGLLDVAGALGIENADTSFGDTLHHWGSGEGAYVELPILGPSTGRDTLGLVVDSLLNPLDLLDMGIEDDQRLLASATSGVETRADMMETIDGILYESDDSYIELRSAWVQNRRRALNGGETASDDLIDLYDDF